MENIDKIKTVYTELLQVSDKYADEDYLSDFEFEDVRNMRKQAKNHLMIIDWQERYGLDIKHDRQFYGYNYVKIDEYRMFPSHDRVGETQWTSTTPLLVAFRHLPMKCIDLSH